MSEVWREVPGAPDHMVSSTGQVMKVATGQMVNQRLQRAGKSYRVVSIKIDGVRRNMSVHRLVAMAFIGPPPSEKHQAAHNDGDPTNNCASNLRWATPKENIADRERHGRTARGARNGQTKIAHDDALFIKRSKLSCAKLAARFGVNPTTIWRIKTGENWAYLPNNIGETNDR